MSDSEADAMGLLMGNTTPSATFPEVGSLVKGEVLDLSKSQQRVFKSKELKEWPDGSPMMQVVVTLQTDERTDEDDDGKRKLYVAKRNMRDAVRGAIQKAGHRGSLVGGTLAVRRQEDDEPESAGISGAHTYIAQYEPPQVLEDEEPF